MKNPIAAIVLLVVCSHGWGQKIIVDETDSSKTELTSTTFRQRFSTKESYTLQNLKIEEDDRLVYQYQVVSGRLLVQKTGNSTYLLTGRYFVPLAPDSVYTPLDLMRTQLFVGKNVSAMPDTAYLHEQLKGRVKKSAELIETWETLKKQLSKNSNWDEYDVLVVEATAVLGWELTLAFLNGDQSLLPILENYRTDIFLVNAGESSAIFRDCENLLAQNGYSQFYRSGNTNPGPDDH